MGILLENSISPGPFHEYWGGNNDHKFFALAKSSCPALSRVFPNKIHSIADGVTIE